jgi:DNA-binding protein Fis
MPYVALSETRIYEYSDRNSLDITVHTEFSSEMSSRIAFFMCCSLSLVIDTDLGLRDNPALLLRGAFMITRPAPLSVLVLTHDQDLPAYLKRELKEVTLTVAKDCESMPRVKRPFDAVLIDAKRGALTDLTGIQRAVDSPQAVIVAAPRDVLRGVCEFLKGMKTVTMNGRAHDGTDTLCLESYLESKLGEFVRGMKNSSGRNLHPMLISAVERPLITFALKETNGNQIQAAQLLGMNRNTLRKKIGELRIPIKREKPAKA